MRATADSETEGEKTRSVDDDLHVRLVNATSDPKGERGRLGVDLLRVVSATSIAELVSDGRSSLVGAVYILTSVRAPPEGGNSTTILHKVNIAMFAL